MDPPPAPPNPQEASPRRVPPNVGGVAPPLVRAARGRARLLDHALFALFLIARWKIQDNRLLYPTMAICLVFFNDNILRSTDFLEATVIRQPLRTRDYFLLGMLVVARFNSMLVYVIPIVLLTMYSGSHITQCLFPQQPRPPRHLLTMLAVLWLVLLFKYDWSISGLFLGYVKDMPFTDSKGNQGLYTGDVNGLFLKPHDIGQLVYESGTKYTGYFENGVKSTKRESVLQKSNGNSYVGSFANDKMEGNCKFMSGDGKRFFEGEMKDGKPNGRGILAEKGGVIYEGEFVNAKKEGRGIMITAEGEKRIGNFRDSRLQGDGIVRRTDHLLPLISGNFKDGLPHGMAITVDKDLNMYIGNFQHGKRHGRGILVTSKGLVQMGNWTDGELHGQADVIHPGSIFSGPFKHGKKHGLFTVSTGSAKYEGEWRDGERVDGKLQ